MRRVWPHVRVLLVALHVVAIVVMAMPNPGPGLDRSAWKNPTVQDELTAWAERLSTLGLDVTPKSLEAWAWSAAETITAVRETLVAPFEPYRKYAGVRQPWNMFVAPHRHPAKLTVDVQVDDEWRPVYRARSEEYDYRSRFFDHDRVRAMLFRYGWPAYKHSFADFARWLAKRLAEDFPEASKARIAFERYKTASPDEVKRGVETKTTRDRPLVFDLAPFREAVE